MTNQQNLNNFDLEKRTLAFSKAVIKLCREVAKNPVNNILVNQLIRSSTSVGANYSEANDALGKNDFILRLRIARKETKETIYWLELILDSNNELESKIVLSIQEATELRNILSAIINKAIEAPTTLRSGNSAKAG